MNIRIATLASMSMFISGCPRDEAMPLRDASISDGELVADDPDAARAFNEDPIAALHDPFAPARRRAGTQRLVSSRTAEPPMGMLNDDFASVRENGTNRILIANEVGPAVVTRMWFTYGPTWSLARKTRIHMYIDDEEVEFLAGESGVDLTVLTSGALPGFPRPWVLDGVLASGGYLVHRPIPYRRSFRMEMEMQQEADGSGGTWYQLDIRDLPGLEVVSFSMPSTDDLEAATKLWLDHRHPGSDVEEPNADIPPGGQTEMSVPPGIITELEVRASERDDLELAVSSEETNFRVPLGRLLGATSPAQSYDSALASATPSSIVLRYPIPLSQGGHITVHNAGTSTRSIGLRMRLVPGSFGSDLGRFGVDCRVEHTEALPVLCEQNSSEQRPNVVVGRASGRGWYAGQSMRLHTDNIWWCSLEADHEVFVDGQYPILGTGTEDYFGAGFFFRGGPFATTWVGATGWTPEDRGGDSLTLHMYRHHVADTIPFEREFRFEYESYPNDGVWDGCSFFYFER